MERHAPRPGFALVEAAAAAAILALLAAALLILASESRRQSSLSGDLANLSQFAAGTAAYAADFQDAVWNLSWQAGINYGFGGAASTDLQARCNQTMDLIRRLADRPDLGNVPTAWLPHVNYVTLVLVDYLDAPLPAPFLASPADRLRRLWQSDPEGGFYALGPSERPGDPLTDSVKMMPYSSSYRLAPAFWTRDAVGETEPAVYQSIGGAFDLYTVPSGSLVTRRLSEVAHPGQKVMMYDQYQRHFGPRQAYFGYAEARVPVLMADGGASLRRTGDSNRGFYPAAPFTPQTTRVYYAPDPWQPPTLNGQSFQLVEPRYKWTRSGLRGRDFNGPEVPWVD